MSHRKAQNLEIDNLDIQILSILMKNATTPYTEIQIYVPQKSSKFRN